MDTSVYRHSKDDALGHLSPLHTARTAKRCCLLVGSVLTCIFFFKNFIPMTDEI